VKGGKRTPPVESRLCRAGCSVTFKLTAPYSPNAVSQQTCSTCTELFIAAMSATHPPPEELARRQAAQERARGSRKRKLRLDRLGDMRTLGLLRQLREHRAEFEGAWRLGADAAHLRAILESA